MKTFLFIICTFFAPLALIAETDKPTEELTLSIIKPDAVAAGHVGEIISRFEKEGLRIAALQMDLLTEDDAKEFYTAHKDRPFYKDLVKFMSSGPIVVMVLQGPDAIAKNRQIMGSTDPKKADKGTLRAEFGTSIEKNAVHGSDSPAAAKTEIDFFFDREEIMNVK
jgi:nucleoside-diphosphate kinase